jgi:nucleoside-diphosphate-sugar epimerase
MLAEEEVYLEDRCGIAGCESVDWKALDHSTVLVTGATGLIGSTLIYGLMEYNESGKGNIKVLALVRNRDKAQKLFSSYIAKGWLGLVSGDIVEPLAVEEDIDYILHGASETASRSFVEKPVETIMTAFVGTRNVLELAREKKVKSMVYMSSMEVYGTPTDDKPLTEERMGYLNPLSVRSSYSESKQMVENLCVSYCSEYKVPVKIVRLTQTFGPGVTAEDSRVFAEFAKCAVAGKDIRLQTKGETQRMYLYTADAATALLTVLTGGNNGEAYNAANTDTYCSIKDMAEMVAREFGNGKCQVVFAIPDTPNASYNPVQHIFLDTTRLEQLGWKAKTGLKDMYRRMICCMK